MSHILEAGSLVLVSGANGYIGSHVVDRLLGHGYRVRGTVRDPSKQAWLQELLEKKHGQGKFELVKVEDFSQDDCFDDAVQGCSAFAHVASDLSFKSDPNLIITPGIQATKNALAAASKEPKLKSFVLTSSSTAATNPQPNKKFHVDASMWNETAVKDAWRPPPYEDQRKWNVYGAGKTQAEQAAWDYVKENKPNFTLNTVLPNANFGTILDSKKQEGSTAGWIRAVCGGQFDKVSYIPPQYFVDVVDTALLHVAALTDSSIKDQRIFAFGEPYNWNQVLAVCRKLRPELDLPNDIEDDSKDLSTVDTDLAVKLLKERFGQDGFKGLEQSLKECLESFL